MQLILKAWRINSGLSLNDVAKKIEKTPRTVQNWESGINMPSKSDLYLLADIYKTNIDSIFLADKFALSEYFNKFK